MREQSLVNGLLPDETGLMTLDRYKQNPRLPFLFKRKNLFSCPTNPE